MRDGAGISEEKSRSEEENTRADARLKRAHVERTRNARARENLI